MIATRSLALIAASLLALAAAACSSDASPADSDDETPGPTSVAISTATPTTMPTSMTPQSGTEDVPPTSEPAPTPPPDFPELEFVDNPDCQDVSREQLPLADVVIRDGTRFAEFAAEMAVATAHQSQGLMCREAVPDGTGMLFIWDEERNGGFWMFNTYVPLDIIYFGAQDGTVSLIQMAPCPRNDGESDSAWVSRCGQEAEQYRPGISYTTTLELQQGWLESLGFDTDNPSTIDVSFTPRD